MEREHRIMSRLHNWWQLHNKCVMVGAAALTFFILVGWTADRLTDGSAYLNTASVAFSIALSLVVIGYTISENVRSEINTDRLGRLMEGLGERLQGVEEGVRSLKPQGPAEYSKEPADSAQGVGNACFSLLSTSDLSRLFAYFLLRSHTLNKPLPMEHFVRIAKPLVKMPEVQLSSHAFGILHGMACCLTKFLLIEDQVRVQLKELPENFEAHVKSMAELMGKRNPAVIESLDKINSI